MSHVISTKHAKVWSGYANKMNKSINQKLEDKSERLSKLAADHPFIPLDAKDLKALVLSHPKDYSFIVLFTSLETENGVKCESCRFYYEEYELLGQTFKRCPAFQTNQMFLGAIDLKDNGDVFEMLNITMTPTLMHFPPLDTPSAEDIMDFTKWGSGAADMSRWIQERTDIKISTKPTTGLVSSLYQLIKEGLRPTNLYKAILCNQDVWACSMLLYCFDMVAGENWITEHDPPRFTFDRKKGFQFVYKNDMHYQFVYETYLVAGIHLCVALGMFVIIESMRREKKDCYIQSVIGAVIIYFFFSVLVAVFRIKEPLYPHYFGLL